MKAVNPETETACAACANRIPIEARFCPHCGGNLQELTFFKTKPPANLFPDDEERPDTRTELRPPPPESNGNRHRLPPEQKSSGTRVRPDLSPEQQEALRLRKTVR